MIIWYNNSILASIVSISGCLLAIAGVAGIREGDLSVGEGLLVIIAGIGIAILGKVISDKKAEKKAEKARIAQSMEKAGDTFSSSVNTGFSTGYTSPGAGNSESYGAEYDWAKEVYDPEPIMSDFVPDNARCSFICEKCGGQRDSEVEMRRFAECASRGAERDFPYIWNKVGKTLCADCAIDEISHHYFSSPGNL